MAPVNTVILAAGAGRRMGGQAKALLDVGGVSFLERIMRTSRESACDPIWVVRREGQVEVERLTRSLAGRGVVNAAPEQGMFSSVLAGLEAALASKEEVEGILIFPVDHPRVRVNSVKALLEAFPGRPRSSYLVPTYRDRGGHPVLLGVPEVSSLLGLEPTLSFREALRERGIQAHPIPVSDPHVCENINTPDDLF